MCVMCKVTISLTSLMSEKARINQFAVPMTGQMFWKIF